MISNLYQKGKFLKKKREQDGTKYLRQFQRDRRQFLLNLKSVLHLQDRHYKEGVEKDCINI